MLTLPFSTPGFIQVTPSLLSNSLLWLWPLSSEQYQSNKAVLRVQVTDFKNEHRCQLSGIGMHMLCLCFSLSQVYAFTGAHLFMKEQRSL